VKSVRQSSDVGRTSRLTDATAEKQELAREPAKPLPAARGDPPLHGRLRRRYRCGRGDGPRVGELSVVYVTVEAADEWWRGGTDRGHVEDRVRTTAKIMVSAVAAAAAVVVVKEETE